MSCLIIVITVVIFRISFLTIILKISNLKGCYIINKVYNVQYKALALAII